MNTHHHRFRKAAAILLALLILALPASATWGEGEMPDDTQNTTDTSTEVETETSTQTGDYVSVDEAEAQRQQEIAQAQQEQQVVGRWELGGGTEAAVLPVVGGGKLGGGGFQLVLPGLGGGGLPLGRQERPYLPGGLQQALPVLRPAAGNGGEQGDEPRLVSPAVFGYIGPGKKGQLVRRHYYGERPAAAAGEGLAGLHINAVHIRALLPVHLYRDVVAVQQRSYLRVLKALPGHHMAPVAGGIADGEEYGLVLMAGPVESLLTPGQPVHGILGVLPEIGGLFLYQTVAHATASQYHLC